MIRHLVIWTFTTPDAVEKDRLAAEVAERLLALREAIPEIGSMEFHRDAAGFERNADLLLESTFADLDALGAYLEHPDHRAVAAWIDSNVRGRAVVDLEV
ncbi:MAG: Dabb family protein [Micrococcales bacterium]|nr:Dabb family protein [Micrococcales bacterium]